MSFLRDLKVAVRFAGAGARVVDDRSSHTCSGDRCGTRPSSVSCAACCCGPLANRDEDRLLYIRQSAPGIGVTNTTFSVPEIQDISDARLQNITELGTFSENDFTLEGLGQPREIHGGVVDGNYFEVMGLHPILGRLLNAHDDGSNAAGAAVLTYRFWHGSLNSDPNVIGKTIRLGSDQQTRTATIVGVLQPAVPYPVDTEMISNIVTSPHHLSATMKTGREHRMTEVFGRLAPGADLDSAPGRAARGIRSHAGGAP